jgi:hypothetical protein
MNHIRQYALCLYRREETLTELSRIEHCLYFPKIIRHIKVDYLFLTVSSTGRKSNYIVYGTGKWS